jgi:excisionase family DNA binding protein
VKDVAKILSVDEETIRRWIRDRKLNAEMIGGRIGYRINFKELDKFLSENKGWLGKTVHDNGSFEKSNQVESPTLSNLTGMNLINILESLLSLDDTNLKKVRIEIIKKEYELECRKATIGSELERIKREMEIVEFELKTLLEIKHEIEN